MKLVYNQAPVALVIVIRLSHVEMG